MPYPTIRISDRAHRTLKELALRSGRPMQAILDHAIEAERRRQFFADVDAAYAKLRDDSSAWSDFQDELTSWEATLMDGLDPNDACGEPRRSAPAARHARKRR